MNEISSLRSFFFCKARGCKNRRFTILLARSSIPLILFYLSSIFTCIPFCIFDNFAASENSRRGHACKYTFSFSLGRKEGGGGSGFFFFFVSSMHTNVWTTRLPGQGREIEGCAYLSHSSKCQSNITCDSFLCLTF